MEALFTAYDLGGVVAAKEGVWLVINITRGHTEGQNRLRDNAVVEERPNVVLFPVDNTLLRGKAKNAIRFLPKTMAFIQRKKLEEGAFVLFLEFVRILKE